MGPLSIDSVIITEFDQDAKIGLIISGLQINGEILSVFYSLVCINN